MLSLNEVTHQVKMVAEDEKYKPTYANDTDYCMDLKVKIKQRANYFKDGSIGSVDSDYDVIQPNECKTFGTGLKTAIPEGWGLFVLPRSSTGFKLNCQLANTMGCIDAGYRDEIKVRIHNFGTTPVMLEDGQRVCQLFLLPKFTIEPIYTEDNEEFRNGDRGGGIGSTGV